MLLMQDTDRALVVATVAEHADSLLRVARRYTDCAADAEDAYQRTMEIFVRNASRLDAATAYKWVHTVCKHEALEVRRQRARLVGVAEEAALDALDDGRYVPSVEEHSERFDEMTRAAEALRRLKPQEVTALVLKAQGLSYSEIAEREGWTYTKVNRCLTEGRRAFLARVAGIESGEECARWAPVLSAMADGEAKARDVLAIRPHLRNCAGCRATLGEMRRAPAAAALLLPVGFAGVPAGGGLLDRLTELALAAQERVVAPLVKAQSAVETIGGGKLAAVAASTAALAGGGVAVQHSSAGEPSPTLSRSAPPAPERVASSGTTGSEEEGPSAAGAPSKPTPVRDAAPSSPPTSEPTPSSPQSSDRDHDGEFTVESAKPEQSAAKPPTTRAAETGEPPSSDGEFSFEPGG